MRTASVQVEFPLYLGRVFTGQYIDESEARGMLSKQEATLVRKGNDRRIILKPDSATGNRIRALCSRDAGGAAISSTYTENLYSETPEQLDRMRDLGVKPTVMHTVISMKKYRPDTGFTKYSETEGFKRNRFNPDQIRKPLYGSEREARAARA